MFDQHLLIGGAKVSQKKAHEEMKKRFHVLNGTFAKELVLGPAQIAAYFSRMKSKKRAAAELLYDQPDAMVIDDSAVDGGDPDREEKEKGAIDSNTSFNKKTQCHSIPISPSPSSRRQKR